jgi:hypothetical protein
MSESKADFHRFQTMRSSPAPGFSAGAQNPEAAAVRFGSEELKRFLVDAFPDGVERAHATEIATGFQRQAFAS